MRRAPLLFLLLSLGLWGVLSGLAHPETRPADACKAVAARKQLACYEQRLALADRELNAVYQHLASSLESTRRQAMQVQSRQWIAYKEALSLESTGITLSLDAAQARRRPEFLIADSVTGKDLRLRGDAGAGVELRGLITQVSAADTFEINGRPVRLTPATVFAGGSAADLALNVHVEGKGFVDADGVLVAVEIEFLP